MHRYGERLARVRASLKPLPDKPEETPESTLRALWHTAAGAPCSAQSASSDDLPALDEAMQRTLDDSIERRLAGVPLSYLTGRQYFMELELYAGPEALIPRRETEMLARKAIEITHGLLTAQDAQPAAGAPRGVGARTAPMVNVVDVCTGSGNVALAIAHQVPKARVTGSDLSEAAIALAERNADHVGIADRVNFVVGDLLAPLDKPEFLGKVDVLTCNPPYIRSAKLADMPAEIAHHEPSLAFDGGPLGIGILMRLVNDAPRFLRPAGALVFEVGAGQGAALIKRLEGLPEFERVESVTDSSGVVRVIAARRAKSQFAHRAA